LRAWWDIGLIKKLQIEGKMYATSVFYGQIYPFLLLGRQFPNLAGCLPPAGHRPASWEHWLATYEVRWDNPPFVLRVQ